MAVSYAGWFTDLPAALPSIAAVSAALAILVPAVLQGRVPNRGA
ncbi:hypothetical protein ACQP1U_15105 [Actinomycetota bacterium]